MKPISTFHPAVLAVLLALAGCAAVGPNYQTPREPLPSSWSNLAVALASSKSDNLGRSMKEAVRVGNEVETLYTNGPAGGGGVTKSAKEIVAVASTLLPRDLALPAIAYQEI